MDRKKNIYPELDWPEIYLLKDGYKRFWEELKDDTKAHLLFGVNGYKPMLGDTKELHQASLFIFSRFLISTQDSQVAYKSKNSSLFCSFLKEKLKLLWSLYIILEINQITNIYFIVKKEYGITIFKNN